MPKFFLILRFKVTQCTCVSWSYKVQILEGDVGEEVMSDLFMMVEH